MELLYYAATGSTAGTESVSLLNDRNCNPPHKPTVWTARTPGRVQVEEGHAEDAVFPLAEGVCSATFVKRSKCELIRPSSCAIASVAGGLGRSSL